jgi:hypothetical protein
LNRYGGPGGVETEFIPLSVSTASMVKFEQGKKSGKIKYRNHGIKR